MIGTIGRLLLIIAFVASGISLFAYFKAARQEHGSALWLRTGRISWITMVATVLLASIALWVLIYTHQFQYNYVWSNTSRDLPWYFLFSSFWAGQEGSFLLWIFYTSLIGLAMMAWAYHYEAPVMTVIALCQVFMVSMVAGIKLGPLAIGSSPFMLLAERFPDAPMLQQGMIPPDGQGLNELLQNIWMVIHPPTLFVGFAALIVPFAYAVAGLWKRSYTDWVRPALPWALFGNLILISGIVMGGYWAYVTLSFGGYWAWDPVENSSLVPWLIGVAAIHSMIAQKRSRQNYKAAVILNILAFIFVVYSTFLTRSGILGDISVHSFVDLGLYNQLLLWIASMGVVGFGVYAYRYAELPSPNRETFLLSREFMIFSGAILLAALAGVIILGTSTPIIGRIFRDNPSGVPIEFYNKWSLPIMVVTAFLIGLGQLFWWTKMSVDTVNKVLIKPLAAAVVSTVLVLLLTPFTEATVQHPAVTDAAAAATLSQASIGAGLGQFWDMYGMGLMLLLLLFASFFALYGNLIVLWRIGRGNYRLVGGALAHVGFALMLLGMLTSSGFNNPLAPPPGTAGGQRDNFIIERNQTVRVEGYQVSYTGKEETSDGHTRYLLDFTDPRGRSFTARPVAFQSNNEQWIQHPHIQSYVERDLFIAVAPNQMFGEGNAATPGTVNLTRGQTVSLGDDYTVTFEDFELENIDPNLVPQEGVDIAVAARLVLRQNATGETRTLRPIYIIKQDRTQEFIQSRATDWNVGLSFVGMQVDNGAIQVAVDGIDMPGEDWLLVQAYEKPMINLLWYGTFLMLAGFGLAMARRVKDEKIYEKRLKEGNTAA